MKRTFYEKRGRRYVPVYEYDSDLVSAMPHGSHLVFVEPGCRTTVYNVKPLRAPLVAAIRQHREALCHELREYSAPQPMRPLTEKERRGYEAWREVMGEDGRLVLTRPSVAALIDKLESLLTESELGDANGSSTN